MRKQDRPGEVETQEVSSWESNRGWEPRQGHRSESTTATHKVQKQTGGSSLVAQGLGLGAPKAGGPGATPVRELDPTLLQ